MSDCARIRLRRLSDTAGSVSLLFALIALLLFSFIGAAVDYSRWNNATSRTSDALDAALLSAGRALQTAPSKEDAIAVAEKAFMENARTRLKLIGPKIKIDVSADGTALEASASGRMKTPFMRLLRFAALDVSATSRVGFGFGSASGGSDLEISMMLDVTGSMCDDGNGPCVSATKLDALKVAASDLVNIVMKGDNSASNVRIAVVPFSTRIRIGPPQDVSTEALMTDLTDLPPRVSSWYKEWTGCPAATSSEDAYGLCTSWTAQYASDAIIVPCVTDRSGPDEFTDAPPGPGRWLNAGDGTRRPLAWDSQGTPINSGDGTGVSAADPSDLWDYNFDGTCWDVEAPNVVMPLSSDKDAILQRVGGLVGYGSTAGALGTAWTWYTLSPAWASVWPADSTPGSYADTTPIGSNPPKLRKIAVLMTDGLYNSHRGEKGIDPVYVSNNAKQICSNMKAQGVEIYTVGFDLSALPPADKARAIDTLESCGSDIQHFYDAFNAEQLRQSFRDIAMQLSQIYISR